MPEHSVCFCFLWIGFPEKPGLLRVVRQQARALQGLGRGGGFFERSEGDRGRGTRSEELIEEAKGGLDVYGRRRGADPPSNSPRITASSGPRNSLTTVGELPSKQDRQKAALERLRNPVAFMEIFPEAEAFGYHRQDACRWHAITCSHGHVLELWLSKHDLQKKTTLTAAIGKWTKLELININNHSLNTLPDELSKLQCLRELKIRKNPLTSLPDTLNLNAFSNRLTSIPSSCALLQNLQGLYLQHNQLTTVPEAVCKLPDLSVRMLNLGRNNLTSLPTCDLPNLRFMNLVENQLTRVPDWVSILPELTSMQLQHNKLRQLPMKWDLPVLKRFG
eukprot:g1292.t1